MEVSKPDVLDIHKPALSSTTDHPVEEKSPTGESDAVPQGETEQEAATVPTEPSGEPRKPPRGVQKRLDELTRLRKEAEERELAVRRQLDEALAVNRQLTEKPRDAAPKPDDFETPDDYEQARVAYLVRMETQKSLDEERRRRSDEEQKIRAQQVKQTWEERVTKAREKYGDYTEVAESEQVPISVPMANAIALSEIGPDIAYHLGKNPEISRRISQLDPVSAIREIGRIEAELSIKPLPKASNAPEPIKPVTGAKEGSARAPQDMSMAEYAQWYRQRREAQH